jgi:hypothetical protein
MGGAPGAAVARLDGNYHLDQGATLQVDARDGERTAQHRVLERRILERLELTHQGKSSGSQKTPELLKG